jgi:hypothetical protein
MKTWCVILERTVREEVVVEARNAREATRQAKKLQPFSTPTRAWKVEPIEGLTGSYELNKIHRSLAIGEPQ